MHQRSLLYPFPRLLLCQKRSLKYADLKRQASVGSEQLYLIWADNQSRWQLLAASCLGRRKKPIRRDKHLRAVNHHLP
jgi:hypothetical protein